MSLQENFLNNYKIVLQGTTSINYPLLNFEILFIRHLPRKLKKCIDMYLDGKHPKRKTKNWLKMERYLSAFSWNKNVCFMWRDEYGYEPIISRKKKCKVSKHPTFTMKMNYSDDTLQFVQQLKNFKNDEDIQS